MKVERGKNRTVKLIYPIPNRNGTVCYPAVSTHTLGCPFEGDGGGALAVKVCMNFASSL